MKTAALILLTCVTSYLAETINIPLSTATVCKKPTPCSAMEDHCMKKAKENKPSKPDSKSRETCCVNCPLNCVTIFELHKPTVNLQLIYKKEYPSIESYILPGYIPGAWKPPNNISA